MSFVYKYDLERGDMLELKIKAFGMKMTIYKHNGSTAKIYVCPDQLFIDLRRSYFFRIAF
jgi:hypothetical protein